MDNRKHCRITINRGKGDCQIIKAWVIQEGNTFLKCCHRDNPEKGEWFSKKSEVVSVEMEK